MTNAGGGSHIGSVFSVADIVAVLYDSVLRIDPRMPDWPDRDRLVLSKGHAGAGIYAALAERGFFSTDELSGHYANGSRFSGHVSHKGIPGVELSTGSLGHGLGVACGFAYAARLKGMDHGVFAVLSDGECDEGSNWEAMQFAGHHRLGRLTAIVDYNKIQSLQSTEETLALEPFTDKWRSFRWRVEEVDGHDHDALRGKLLRSASADDRPLCVIAHTVKGKGVSFMENQVLWHYRIPRGDEFDAAMQELLATE
jgi:transketolase